MPKLLKSTVFKMDLGYAQLVKKLEPKAGFIVGVVVGEQLCTASWCSYLAQDLEQVEPVYDSITLAYKNKILGRELRLKLMLNDYKNIIDFDLGVLLPYALRETYGEL